MSKEEEKIYFNALNLASSANYHLLSFLKSNFSSFKKAYEEVKEHSFSKSKFSEEVKAKFFEKKKKIDPFQEWEKLKKKGIQLFLLEEKNYPPLLKEIPFPPLGIYQLGNFSLEKNFLAVVGTRKMSSYGKMAVEKFVKDLSQINFTIVSGLAYGIDSLAHQIALENKAETIAVLASGLDIIFPSSNKKLAEKISHQGALLSEYPLGTPPLKNHFPQRNRIISGLSLGVLVIEAPIRSGALITARFALEQNREVFTIPGPLFSKNLEGNHELIKSGAKLITRLEDILWELNLEKELTLPKEKKILPQLNEEEKIIFEIISSEENPISIEKILEKTELPINSINRYLTFLELKNLIKRDGNYYRKAF